jgi:hypothetical protein
MRIAATYNIVWRLPKFNDHKKECVLQEKEWKRQKMDDLVKWDKLTFNTWKITIWTKSCDHWILLPSRQNDIFKNTIVMDLINVHVLCHHKKLANIWQIMVMTCADRWFSLLICFLLDYTSIYGRRGSALSINGPKVIQTFIQSKMWWTFPPQFHYFW